MAKDSCHELSNNQKGNIRKDFKIIFHNSVVLCFLHLSLKQLVILILQVVFYSRKNLLHLCCILEINFLKPYLWFVSLLKRIILLYFTGSWKSQSNMLPGSGKICMQSIWARGDLALIQTGNKKCTNSLATSSSPTRLVKQMFHIHKNTSNWFSVYTMQQGAPFWPSLHQEVVISLFNENFKKGK